MTGSPAPDTTFDLRDPTTTDVIVVGAGFGGLYATHAMRQLGMTVQGFEAGSSVGGTWFWNRYPGARCDIESMEYSFSFDDELAADWEWSERYATQTELLAYADHIADRYELRDRFRFNTRVESATFLDDDNCWQIVTDTGRTHRAQWLFLATGGISVPRTPAFPGMERFEGVSTHTAEWPPDGLDVAGKRVAIIGTGSSAIQAIPELAASADQLFVLQRSPNYVVPSHNSTRDLVAEQEIRADYRQFRRDNDQQSNGFGSRWDRSERSVLSFSDQERQERFDKAWAHGGFSFLFTFGDLTANEESAEHAARFIRGKIAEIVTDPATADLVTPRHIFGCRRLCVGTDYYETFNRSNVTVVSVADRPITEITPTGIRYGDHHLEVDVVIYATGFEDQAESLKRMSITGIDLTVEQAWHRKPQNYLGVSVAGFPNLFMVNMPGSPSIATNMITNTEFTVDWIAGCIGHAQDGGWNRIEVDQGAQQEWTDYVDSIAVGKVYEHCANLYTAVDSTGRRFAYPHLGVPAYLERIRASAAAGFSGLHFSHHQVTRPDADLPTDSPARTPAEELV